MGALKHVYGVDDRRRTWLRFSVSLALGAAVLSLVLTALFLVALGPTLFGALPGPLAALARWVLVVACLWATITLLIRLAPAEHRAARWVTIGSLVVIAAWLAASVSFGFYARDVASFESPLGYVVAGLVLTGYLYTSAIVFLVGVEVDELLREASEGRPVRRGRRARRRRAPRRRSAGGAA